MDKHRHLYTEYIVISLFLAASSAAILFLPGFAQFKNAVYTQFGLFCVAILVAILFSYSYTRQYDERLAILLKKSEKANEKLKSDGQVQDRIIALTHELMDIQNTENAFDKILEYAISSIDHAVAGSIMLIDENDKLRFTASKGYNHEALIGVYLDIKETFLWHKTNGNIIGPVIVNNATAFSKAIVSPDIFKVLEQSDKLSFESTLSSPLFLNGKLYGMLNVDSTRKNAFGNEALRLMDYFTTQAEFAIKNRELMEHIYHLSRFDSLTKIFNRRYFKDIMELDIQKSSRYEISFLLVLFDLDGLKHINDTYGHLAGDRCLFHFANELNSLVRKQDILARYGGDEFIASFYQCGWKDLTIRIEEFREHFRTHPCIFNDIEIPISFSYGISEFPADGETYTDLVRKADSLMYTAKRKFKQLSFLSKDSDLPR
jgi:diguanylate cyclase (GGDEF)-like protein